MGRFQRSYTSYSFNLGTKSVALSERLNKKTHDANNNIANVENQVKKPNLSMDLDVVNMQQHLQLKSRRLALSHP